MSTINKPTYDMLEQLKSGSYGKSGDLLFHTLYDQVTVQAGTVLTQEFFTTPIGQIVGGVPKSIALTNLRDTGKLPAGNAFIANKIRLGFFNGAATAANITTQINNFYTALSKCNVEIRIVGREFDFQCQGNLFLPNVANTALTGAADGYVRVGDYLSAGSVKLLTPVIISELVSFKVVMNFDSTAATALTALNGAGSMFHWDLIGMLARKK